MVITCDTARSGEARGRSYPPAGLMLLSECREVAAKREGRGEGVEAEAKGGGKKKKCPDAYESTNVCFGF